LPTIETKISEFKTESLTQQQQIKELHQTLNALLTNTKEIIELLRQIQSESVLRRIVALFTRANTKKV
jgi:flagellar basal body P-ring protein FlgI